VLLSLEFFILLPKIPCEMPLSRPCDYKCLVKCISVSEAMAVVTN